VRARQPDRVATEDDRQVREMLRGYGLRRTTQRIAVLHVLDAADAGVDGRRVHLTASQIHDRLRDSGNHIDLTTVYRTLTTLVNLGVLHTITTDADQPTSYGFATAAHHHVICTRCGAVSEIPAERLGRLLDLVRDVTGFQAEDEKITVHSQCPDCQNIP
jgi:Fe2+ or Zn2+ uptake regulation protein